MNLGLDTQRGQLHSIRWINTIGAQVPFFIGYIPFVHLTIQNDTEGRTKSIPSKSYSSQE